MTLLLQGHTRREESHRSQCLDPEASLTDSKSKRGGQAEQSSWPGEAPTAQPASIPVYATGHPCSWSSVSEDRCLTTGFSLPRGSGLELS